MLWVGGVVVGRWVDVVDGCCEINVDVVESILTFFLKNK